MPFNPPGKAADIPVGPAVRLASVSGAFGAGSVDGMGARAGLTLELRARELMDRLVRHHVESADHSLRVAEITMGMWRMAPGLFGNAETALLGSLLHDIGKLQVPRAILASPRLLAEEERGIMASHAEAGADMLLAMGFPESIAAIARSHHERWAGGGYPSSRSARNLAPIVRAVAVADAFDAMTDPGRLFRKPLSRREALREVADCAGTHFDPVAGAILADSLSRAEMESRGRRTAIRRTMPGFAAEPAAVH